MKTALIIGGSSGIGNELVQILQSKGNQVFYSYFTNENNQLKDLENVHPFPLDVTSDELNLPELPDVIDYFAYLPGSVNLKPFKSIKEQHLLEDYKLQIIGFHKVFNAIQKQLKNSEQASVVTVSSVAASTGFPYHGVVSATKGAIEGLTKALSAEYAPKIRFNTVAPSLTNTPLTKRLLNSDAKIEANAERHPLKAVGEAKDIANALSFLLSEESKWMTGQVLHVDGGISSIKS